MNLSLAACIGSDPELWFPPMEEESNPVAIEACRTCPIRVQCREYGLENGEWGIWGGTRLEAGVTV